MKDGQDERDEGATLAYEAVARRSWLHAADSLEMIFGGLKYLLGNPMGELTV
jgi:hypothetical protein